MADPTAGALQGGQLKPAIQVAEVFKLIINQAGYTLNDSAFLSSDAWTKLYMTLGDNMESVATRGVTGLQVGRNSEVYLREFCSSCSSNGVPITPNFDADSGAGGFNNPPLLYDEADNWNTTTLEFTAPATGHYSGEFHLRFNYTGNFTTPANQGVYIWWGIEGMDANAPQNNSMSVTGVPGAIPENGSGSGPNVYHTPYPLNWSCWLEAGQTINPYLTITYTNPTGSVFLVSAGTYFSVTASNLTLQPWQDYIDLGTQKDWTDRLDLSKKRTLTPPDRIRNKFVEFRDSEDSTKHNALFENVNGCPIGKYSQEIESDFAQGTLSNSPLFAPFQVSPVPTLGGVVSDVPDFLIAKLTHGDGGGPIADGKPKLFYHNGLRTLDGGATFYVGDVANTKYPLCLNFLTRVRLWS